MKIVNSIVFRSTVMGLMMLFTASAVLMAADTGKTTASDAGSGPQQVTIPKDAVPLPDGSTFTWTDKDGKKWIYKKTPFGVVRGAARDEAAATKSGPASAKAASDASASAKPGGVRAIDKGDTVRFERSSPLGPVIWEKKKSELTEDERHILESQNTKTEKK